MSRKGVRRTPPVKVKCSVCRNSSEWDPCFYCLRTCRRKKKYDSQPDALRKYWELVKFPWDDPTLNVYRCRVCFKWHLGHLKGAAGRKRARRIEKLRRKEMLKAVSA